MFGFTQANIIGDASNTYNCHAYAYHVSEGGNRVWMNNVISDDYCDAPLSHNIDQYWEDACIIQVASESDAEKVHYYRGDHSAIRLSSGMYQSKWGSFPLIRHAAADVDYCDPVVSRRYYSSFNVTASNNLVCSGSTATFTTPDYVDCTFNWTYDTNLLDYVSGQGTKTFVVEPKYSYSQGQAWVKLELTIDLDPDVTRENTKNVWVGDPITPEITGNPYIDCSYSLFTDANMQSVTWSVYGPLQIVGPNQGYKCTVQGTGTGMGWVYATASNDCNPSVRDEFMVQVSCGLMLVFTPNPTNGETIVSIETDSQETTFDETAPWDLEVYSETQLLKTKQTNLRGRSAKIQTAGWKEGIYIVRVNYNDEILTGKLLVKR